MKPWAPAVAVHDMLGDYRAWIGIEAGVFILVALAAGLKAATITAIILPFAAMGFLLLYGLAALAPSALHAALVGLALGILFVFLQGIGEGIGPSEALVAFISPIIPLLLFRAIHVYVSPIWTAPEPD